MRLRFGAALIAAVLFTAGPISGTGIASRLYKVGRFAGFLDLPDQECR